jgi:hypothetical protein
LAAEDIERVEDFDGHSAEAGVEGAEEARGPPADDGDIYWLTVVVVIFGHRGNLKD